MLVAILSIINSTTLRVQIKKPLKHFNFETILFVFPLFYLISTFITIEQKLLYVLLLYI